MQSILAAMVEAGGAAALDFDFVLVVGHFLTRDENIFTFFEVRGRCRACHVAAWYVVTTQSISNHRSQSSTSVGCLREASSLPLLTTPKNLLSSS